MLRHRSGSDEANDEVNDEVNGYALAMMAKALFRSMV